MTNFPSAVSATPVAAFVDDPSNGFTAVMTFNVTEATPVYGARWYSLPETAGVLVYAVLGVKGTGGSWQFSSILATSTPAVTATVGWMTIPFPAAVNLTTGVNYAIAVAQAATAKYTALSGVFPKTDPPFAQGSTSEGAFSYGPPHSTFSTSQSWYGLDIASGTDAPSQEDALALSDSVTVVRGGLPTSVTLSTTVTDTLAASTTVGKTVTVAASGTSERVVHYLQRNRPNFSSLVDSRREGPVLASESIEVGVRFTVQRACTLTGARIYKHPAATGSIPVTLWNYATRASLGGTTLTWTADDGGWREFDLSTPVGLVPGVEYAVSYFANGVGYTAWRFNAQDYYEWPFKVVGGVYDNGDGTHLAGGCYLTGSHGFPYGGNTATWYWIDPRVEYDSPVKMYTGGKEYFDQWPNGNITGSFPIMVFAVDTGNFAAYKAMGVNLPLPWDVIEARDEIVAAGANFIGNGYPSVVRAIISDPPLAALCKAYNYWDEPDMQGTGDGTVETMRAKFVSVRQLDSSRPMYFGFGNQMLQGQGFAWFPNGATSEFTSNMWRQQATLTDMMSGDDYSITSNRGIWNYAVQADRLRDMTDGRVPIWATVETAIQVGGTHNPTFEESKRAAMISIIHGARGIIWFDHQFPFSAADGTYYPLDFQVMLHDPVKKAGLTAFHAFLQTIADALWAPEAGLLTSVVSSNKTAGPSGGVLGVPIDTTTRVAGANKYLFAQAARSGTTTGTFVIASAASKTLTVLNESRTVSTNGSGQFTDNFTSDYEYHIYRWT